MEKVLLGMSGGVDSSVSAYLLKKQGYEVCGATMVLFGDEKIEELIKNSQSVIDAKKVCEKLNIEHHVIDLREVFKKNVIDNFINSYKKGETPNPCVQCNKFLKFGALWDKAQELGASYIATGHYAKIEDGYLKKSDSKKDQSYFLYGINKEVLNHIIFPLENYHDKQEIRDIAEQIGLEVAKKHDSQEICFITDNDYGKFLENNLDKLPDQGSFINKDGKILGKHKGIIYYTIGQRKGLGISSNTPLYVINIDSKNNTVTLGEEKDLYSSEIIITNTNMLVQNLPGNVMAKARYRSTETPATVEVIDENNMKIIFKEPVKSITKGQSLVMYDKNICLGGGIIKEILN